MVDRGFGIEVEGEYGDLTITKNEFDPNWWNQAESIDFKLNDEPVSLLLLLPFCSYGFRHFL